MPKNTSTDTVEKMRTSTAEKPVALTRGCVIDAIRALPPGSKILAICHDDPDIDAMSSLMALTEVLVKLGHEVVAAYAGQLLHTQNKYFSNKLDFIGKTVRLKKDVENQRDFSEHRLIVVDTSCRLGTANLKESGSILGEMQPWLVIDHHNKVDQPDGTFYLRERVGACATLIFELAEELDVELSSECATGLMLGIETDTDSLRSDGTDARDYEVSEKLRKHIDPRLYMDVVDYPRQKMFRDLKARAYAAMIERENMVVTGVGVIDYEHKSLIANIADEFIKYDDVKIACVVAIMLKEDKKYLTISFRMQNEVVDSDELVKAVFGPTFGGKKGACGGQMELDEETLSRMIGDVLSQKHVDWFGALLESYADSIIEKKTKLS